MRSRTTRDISVCVLVAALTMGVSACSASPAPARPAASTSGSGSAGPSPEATEFPASGAAVPTCKNLLDPDTVSGFTDAGWSPREEPFLIGDKHLTRSISCAWADFKEASGTYTLFGWAAISTKDARAAIDTLVAAGWRAEPAPEGTYVTEDPEQSLNTDGDGYGTTYEFGAGWVTIADTKENLALIVLPR